MSLALMPITQREAFAFVTDSAADKLATAIAAAVAEFLRATVTKEPASMAAAFAAVSTRTIRRWDESPRASLPAGQRQAQVARRKKATIRT